MDPQRRLRTSLVGVTPRGRIPSYPLKQTRLDTNSWTVEDWAGVSLFPLPGFGTRFVPDEDTAPLSRHQGKAKTILYAARIVGETR